MGVYRNIFSSVRDFALTWLTMDAADNFAMDAAGAKVMEYFDDAGPEDRAVCERFLKHIQEWLIACRQTGFNSIDAEKCSEIFNAGYQSILKPYRPHQYHLTDDDWKDLMNRCSVFCGVFYPDNPDLYVLAYWVADICLFTLESDAERLSDNDSGSDSATMLLCCMVNSAQKKRLETAA